jgi:DNA (cytosine-5)-methyltransferase 1
LLGVTVIDLFCGAGGWDVAAHALGMSPLGIEFADAPVATHQAAGFDTLQADIAELDPLDFAPCEGLIASPPCQAFSMAGKGQGRQALDAYQDAIGRWLEGKPPSRDELDAECEDERGHLVLEPLRWALALRPRWIACEQVAPVLPLWKSMADAFVTLGYSAWAGVLSSECYGVPQTRKRAILLARLDGEAREPRATHQRYVAPQRRKRQTETLFELPDAQRIVHPDDHRLLPWVSMAEALGWITTEAAPAPTVTSGGTDTGGAEVFGKGGRERVERMGRWQFKRSMGAGMAERSGERRSRSADEPAPTIDHAARSSDWGLVNGKTPNAAVRSIDEPAPTIMSAAHCHNDRRWVLRSSQSVAGEGRAERDGDAPSFAVTSNFDRARVVETNNFTAVERDADGERSRDGSVPYARSVDEPAPTLDTSAGGWSVRDGEGPHGLPVQHETGNTTAGCADRPVDEPSRTITGRSDQLEWEPPSHVDVRQVGATPRSVDAPAPTMLADGLAKGVPVWTSSDEPIYPPKGQRRVAGPGAERDPRSVDEPSYTLRADGGGGSDGIGRSGGVEWVGERPAPTVVTTRRSDEGMIVGRQLPEGEGRNIGGHGWYDEAWARRVQGGFQRVPADEQPSPTIKPGSPNGGATRYEDLVKLPMREGEDFVDNDEARRRWGLPSTVDDPRRAENRGREWSEGRLATTVVGDPRVPAPGHKNDEQSPESPGRMEGAVRVSVGEAAILQSFPLDFPWQGTRTRVFEQIGNAVPPLLAYAILAEVTDAAQAYDFDGDENVPAAAQAPGQQLQIV